MPRQIDEAGSKTLLEKIEGMNVRVHLGKSTREFLGNGKVEGLAFADGGRLDVDMVVISAGIRPRDELARACGLEVGPARRGRRRRRAADVRSGHLRRRRGRLASRDGLRPGRAGVRDGRGRRGEPRGLDADLLRLRHVDQAEAHGRGRRQLRRSLRRGRRREGLDVRRPVRRRLQEARLRAPTGTRLLGGVLVGDASDFGTLLGLFKSGKPLAVPPGDLLVGGPRRPRCGGEIDAQVCSCNNVGERQIREAVRDQKLTTVAAGQDLHAGRHGLRRLPAARRRPAQGRARRRRARGSTTGSASTSRTAARSSIRSP